MGRIVIGGIVILAVLLGLRQFSQMQSGGTESEAAPPGGAGSEELISYISHGEAVDIASHVPSEGYAIVEFTADW